MTRRATFTLLAALSTVGCAHPAARSAEPTPPARVDATRGETPTPPAPRRRALVVGIDTYALEHWPGRAAAPVGRTAGAFSDLDGAARDADAMVALLTGRFGFAPASVVSLRDVQATRGAILEAIERHLVAPARAGDTLVFYYSGHGSEVKHVGAEGDKDETIVPADTVLGALDIRDKELARLWNRALDAGATLTVIMDSCHSGGTSRGARPKRLPPAVQELEPITLARVPDRAPLALFLSASTKDQSAEETASRPVRGAFTQALERAIAGDPAQTVASLFTRVHAELRSGNYSQDPVLSGSRSRSLDLLGSVARPTPAVFGFVSADPGGGGVALEGGGALGLTAGSRLQLWAGGKRDPTLELEATQVELARSKAKVVAGDPARAATGAAFVVSSLALPPSPLRVHVPTDGPTDAELERVAGEVRKLAETQAIRLVADPDAVDPDVVVTFEGGAWTYQRRDGSIVALGSRLEAARILALAKQARAGAAGRPTVFVAIPPPATLGAALAKVLTADGACRLAPLAESDYALVGRLQGAAGVAWYWAHSTLRPEPGWLLPATTDARVGAGAELAAQLDQQLDTLVRIHGWVQLRSGAGVVGTAFPFALSFEDTKTPGQAATGLQGGHEYRVVLTPTARGAFIAGQYLYLLNIDANGAGTLVYPHANNGDVALTCDPEDHGGACVLRFPRDVSYLDDPSAALKLCTADMRGCAFGRELFFLIATDDQITDLRALEWDPVRMTRGGAKAGCTPLNCLLQRTGTRSPMREAPVPARWSIQRVELSSAP